MRLPGALRGMDRRRRIALEVGSRFPDVGQARLSESTETVRADPEGLLDRLITTWSLPDQIVFERKDVYDLFMQDLHQVFTVGAGPITLAHELTLYRNYGVSLRDLPPDKRITLWHGLSDNIVPPAMACKMALALPNCEAHLVAGGHFVAVDIAGQIIARLRQSLDEHVEITATHQEPDRMSFKDKDHFSGHAACYQQFRPNYPDALFAYLASLCPAHELAWDCATGNGQAAVALAPHFDSVIATDASAQQIDQAQPQTEGQVPRRARR